MEQLLAFASSEYEAMNQGLNRIVIEAANDLQKAEQSCLIVQRSLENLKEFLNAFTFPDRQGEIHFFKEIKPRFYKELIYFKELFYVDSGKPVSSQEELQRYYLEEMDRVRKFFERNHDLHIYYLTGKNTFDELYFVRGAEPMTIMPEYSPDIDPRFTTVAGFKISKIQAYEKLHRYLQHCLDKLSGAPSSFTEIEKPQRRKSLWTDSKVALIEVAYALHSKGAVNNGTADVKDIVADFEEIFNIDLGNVYAVFQQNIRIRKKSRTAYLDELKMHLEQRMDDQDVNPKY